MTKFLLPTLLSFSLLACTAADNTPASGGTSQFHASQDHQHHHSGSVAPAVHGMVIFGSETLYASHIPMFMSPHDWQALFKVTLSHPTSDAMALYKAARGFDGDPTGAQVQLTLKPKPFVLPDLLEGKVQSFEADLYLGNFEAGGKKLLGGISVKVEKVLAMQHLAAETKALASLSYFLLQDGEKGYLVHQISAPDNFDHILEVNLQSSFPAAGGGLPILDFGLADGLSSAPKSGQSYKLSAEGKLIETSSGGEKTLQIGSTFYCTLGPDFFQTCQ